MFDAYESGGGIRWPSDLLVIILVALGMLVIVWRKKHENL